MSLLPQSDPQAAPGAATLDITAPPTPDAAPTEMPASSEFPPFGDRLSRVGARFIGKPGSFLALGFLFALSTAGGQLVPELLPGASGYTPLFIRSGLSIPAAIFAMALGVCAAFKAGMGKALVVGLKRGLGIIGIGLAILMVLVLPTLLFIVPGIILSFRFMLAVPVYVVEKRGGFEALNRSRDLVYGRTRKLFLEWLLVGLLPTLIVGGAQFGIRMATGGATGQANMTSVLIAAAVGMLLQTFTVPLLVIYLQVFYEDCVMLDGQDWIAHPKRAKLYGVLGTLGFLTAIILSAVAAPAIAFVTLYLASKSPGAVTPIVNVPQVTQPPPEVVKEPTPEERDLARYGDVNTIKIALTTYQGDNKAYPDTLDALAPKYLSAVPADPLTKAPYGYVRVGLSYKLSFILEVGIFALSPGEHYLTPNGFDVEPIQTPPPPPEGETTVTTVPSPDPPPEPVNPLPEEPVPPTEGQPQTPPDTDGDGLSDDDERTRGTDPANSDTDKDGLSDGEEVNAYTTDPLKADTDGDGFTDADELYGGFNPNGEGRLPDTDGDGLADLYESQHGFDAADKDMDNDGLSDGDELRVYRTDHLKADTDGDGFTDPQELQGGFEPIGPGELTPERKAQMDADAKKYGLY